MIPNQFSELRIKKKLFIFRVTTSSNNGIMRNQPLWEIFFESIFESTQQRLCFLHNFLFLETATRPILPQYIFLWQTAFNSRAQL